MFSAAERVAYSRRSDCCQRRTVDLGTPVIWAISRVLRPSAARRVICGSSSALRRRARARRGLGSLMVRVAPEGKVVVGKQIR